MVATPFSSPSKEPFYRISDSNPVKHKQDQKNGKNFKLYEKYQQCKEPKTTANNASILNAIYSKGK